jgi:hypothetical protein
MRAREQRMVVNREKFEARSGVPASFSEFQLQQYLKASALRWGGRECDVIRLLRVLQRVPKAGAGCRLLPAGTGPARC